MIIAGGVYVEKCIAPDTLQLLGSGGRAALALSAKRAKISLHTFQPDEYQPDLEANFAPYGITCRAYPSRERITFSYLFPLGRPSRSPAFVEQAGEVLLTGAEILSFGCVEGRFVVDARSAIYDPQGEVGMGFRASGSRAARLAIVLNAEEALSLTGTSAISEAGPALMQREIASVVVVKDGPNGALVFSDGRCDAIPPYDSRSLYKIGSGDIFTATFADHWLRGCAPADAADHASRQTAAYVESPVLPLGPLPLTQRPRRSSSTSEVVLVVSRQSLSKSWQCAVVKEAIEYLGFPVVAIFDVEQWMKGEVPGKITPGARALVIAENRQQAAAIVSQSQTKALMPVIFIDAFKPSGSLMERHRADLSQALYELCWAP